MSASSGNSISVVRLSKCFGDRAVVDDVTFSAAKGSALALLGPSGCGKTTILRCIAGLEIPDEGRIEVDGRVVFDSAEGVSFLPERRGLGVVFQSYAVWPHMSVEENVAFPLRIARSIVRKPQRASAKCSMPWASPPTPSVQPPNLAAASSSASHSRAPWCTNRALCCSTRPCRIWTSCCANRCDLN